MLYEQPEMKTYKNFTNFCFFFFCLTTLTFNNTMAIKHVMQERNRKLFFVKYLLYKVRHHESCNPIHRQSRCNWSLMYSFIFQITKLRLYVLSAKAGNNIFFGMYRALHSQELLQNRARTWIDRWLIGHWRKRSLWPYRTCFLIYHTGGGAGVIWLPGVG